VVIGDPYRIKEQNQTRFKRARRNMSSRFTNAALLGLVPESSTAGGGEHFRENFAPFSGLFEAPMV